MSDSTEHIYTREFDTRTRSSLTVLANLVTRGARVLDVGLGGGALGAHLSQKKSCTVDGLTYNPAEAEQALTHYRNIRVADLDRTRLRELFAPAQYDCIICADVLEHLREPENVLDDCKTLLASGGSLFISIPNVSYSGLIAELLEGDFEYRQEGLLDRTHVRFFTRRSMLRLLSQQGWSVQSVESIGRDLCDSEFRPRLELLAPSVREQLFARAEGQAYQYVFAAQAQSGAASEPLQVGQTLHSAELGAHYVLQLYYADTSGYGEDKKLLARAKIESVSQDVVFQLPESGISGLRLDPSDRPGFLYLHDITLKDKAGGVLWKWDHDIFALQRSALQLLAVPAGLHIGAGALLLVGDDPQIALPIAPGLLQSAAGGSVCVSLSWPMSADYQQLADRAALAQFESGQLLQRRTQEYELALGQLATEREAAVHRLTQERDSVVEQLAQVQHGLEQAQYGFEQSQAACAALEQARESLEATAMELPPLRALVTELETKLQLSRSLYESARHQSTLCAHALEETKRLATQRQKHIAVLEGQIHDILNSRILRIARPVLRLKTTMDSLFSASHPTGSEEAASPAVAQPQSPVVDIIVPVYRGLSDTRCCVESVLDSGCTTSFRLILINDCSPEPEVAQYLREAAARDPRIVLLENENNLGFVGTVNRGMALDGQNDVVLLNSDAEVANDWLDRIRRAAYAGARVGSVTPLSNNATICSYPRFCEPNELPPDCSTGSLDLLCKATNPGAAVDVPTGVGFCMYIRRECLAQVGLFDVAHFGKGYGEENDFCMRSAYAGWRHLLLLDTFVRHAGGVSFGEAKTPRERDAVEILRRLHPTYDRLVHEHVSADPARLARLKIDLARIRAMNRPGIVLVTHSRGGGTERHVRELAAHLADTHLCFALRPSPSGATELEWVQDGEALRLNFRLPDDLGGLLDVLRTLGVAHIHYHHLIGHHPCVWGLPDSLGLTHDFTAHDYYAACPQISLTDAQDRYCEERGVEQCRDCLRRRPAPGNPDIEVWRSNYAQLLGSARYVLAPSADAAQRISRYFPSARVRVAPHKDLPMACVAPQPAPLGERALRVAIIGALSPIKGADTVEAVAKLAAAARAPVEFHLLGYGYRPLATQPKAALTVHGAYEDSDLDALLQWLKPDLVWFPALWPETYSYTLSACLKASLPVVVPDVGAFKERIAGRAWSWVAPWDSTPAQWLGFFASLRATHFALGNPPLPASPEGSAPLAFDYREEYVQTIVPPTERPPLAGAVLAQHANVPQSVLTAVTRTARGRMALRLAQLKRSPRLRLLAQWVPLHWQTRLKTWLLK